MNSSLIDSRIIKISFQVKGKLKTYSSPLFIQVNGTKYANALQNQCDVIIANLDKATQDYILTETTPFNLNTNPKTLIVEAGRVSYGTSTVYMGNIVMSDVTQPPDVGVTLKCLTGNFLKTNVLGVGQAGQATLFQITNAVAQDLNSALNFEATNKNISNYIYAGSSLNQIQLLNTLGGINVYQDDNKLIAKDKGNPLRNTLKIVSKNTGMIGIPKFTEQGLTVKFLFDNRAVIGGLMRVISEEYKAVNGDYIIYKLGFQLATRDTPFYYIAEGQRIL